MKRKKLSIYIAVNSKERERAVETFEKMHPDERCELILEALRRYDERRLEELKRKEEERKAFFSGEY